MKISKMSIQHFKSFSRLIKKKNQLDYQPSKYQLDIFTKKETIDKSAGKDNSVNQLANKVDSFNSAFSKVSRGVKEKLAPPTVTELLKKTKIFSATELREALELNSIREKGLEKSDRLFEGRFDIEANSKIRISENTKIWAFYKPAGCICDNFDRTGKGRIRVKDYLKNKLKIKTEFYTIGKLDFNCQGLILVTNNRSLKESIESFEGKWVYTYKLKVHGRFTDEKLDAIRRGCVIKGRKIGPFMCEVKRVLNRNTIIYLRNRKPTMRDIKMILQKNSLLISQLVREKIGPYNLVGLKPGEMQELQITSELKKMYFLYKRELLKVRQNQLEQKINSIKKAKTLELIQHESVLKKLDNLQNQCVNEGLNPNLLKE